MSALRIRQKISRAVQRIETGSDAVARGGYSDLLAGMLDGEVSALTTLGTLLTYHVRLKDVRQLAYVCYVTAARRHDLSAQYNLGTALIEGCGIAKNLNEGLRWLRLAKRRGSFEAVDYLGYCYREGIGVRKDPKKGFQLSLAAAEKGVAAAQYAVGVCLLRGLGVEKDKAAGWTWVRRGARNGDHSARDLIRERKARTSRRSRITR